MLADVRAAESHTAGAGSLTRSRSIVNDCGSMPSELFFKNEPAKANPESVSVE